MKKTAIITGALGQDGSLLAAYLLARNYRVIGFVARRRDSTDAMAGVEIIETDIANSDTLRDLFRSLNPQEIYHLAAAHHSSEQESGQDMRDIMLRTNFQATQAILNAVSEVCPTCRVLFAGSSQMFTPDQDITIVDETTPFNPSTYYGLMKVASAQLIELMRKENGVWATTAILFNHESTRRDAQFLSRKVTSFAANARRAIDADKEPHPAKLEVRNLDARVDWSAATDIVVALHLALTAKIPTDYVLASGQVHSVRDLLREAFSAVDLNWREFVLEPPILAAGTRQPCLQGNSQKAMDTLGWRPQQTFSGLIREMVDFDLHHQSGQGH